jgi:hypothetical protein
MSEGKGLFERWIEIETAHKSQVEMIKELNDACGTKYDKSWPQVTKQRGYSLERTPIKVRRYMMKVVLPTLVKVDDKSIEGIIISLT